MSWRRVKPNLAKSKSISSTSLIAIGSSMTGSGPPASVARTSSVSSAVSETPVSAEPSALLILDSRSGSSQHLLDRPQVARRRRRLVTLLTHRLPDRRVQRALVRHLPVDDALAALDPFVLT